MRVLKLILLVLCTSALSAFAVESRTTEAVAMPPATLAQLSRVVVPAAETRDVEIHEHRHAHKSASILATKSASIGTAATTIASPPVTTNFQDDGPSGTVPADAAGAVGPRNVVGVDNNGIIVRDRSGNLLVRTNINQFWSDPAVAGGLRYDSRIAYDPVADRFVLIALWDQGNPIGERSTFLLAVTATGDPTGTWRRFYVRVDPANRLYGDYTRLGLTDDSVVATYNEWEINNDFEPVSRSILKIAKSDLYQTVTAPVTTTTIAGGLDMVPVTTLDRGDATFWVAESDSAGVSVYDGRNSFNRVLHFNPPIQLSDEFTTALGEQFGSPVFMDTGDAVPQTALLRNGVLWVVQTAIPTSGKFRTAIGYWRVQLVPLLATFTLIDDPTAATMRAFPSIAVNRTGAALLAYAEFNKSHYIGAAFTLVDSSGNSSTSTLLKTGDAPYNIDRWDDFTTTVVDPVDDTGFWTTQCFPNTPSPLLNRQVWSTWWFNIPMTTPPPKHRAAKH